MKRVLTLAIVLVMALTLSVSAFALPGAFIQSPSLNDDITLLSFEHDEPNCMCELILTNYKDRHTLTDAQKADIEAAYASIASNDNLAVLVPTISSFTGADEEDLAVSDLFYAHVVQKLRINSDGSYTINLANSALDQFEGLMRYDNGSWVLVENAEILADGSLQFTTYELGAFALAVNTSEEGPSAPTGDNLPLYAAGILMLAAVAVAVVYFKNRKLA